MNKLIILLLLIIATPVWAVETVPMTMKMKNTLFDDLSTNLACLCGCGVTLKSCPHESCSFAIPVRKQIWKLMDSGVDRAGIIANLVKARGEVVLASPTFKGFNMFAWITPFVLMLIVGYGIVSLLRSWSGKQNLATAGSVSEEDMPSQEINKNDPQYKRLQDELDRFEA